VCNGVRKQVVNNTEFDLSITLFVRKGANINAKEFGTVCFDIDAGSIEEIEYGNLQNGYLNGIRLAAKVDGSDVCYMEMVSDENCALDQRLNCSDTISIGRIEHFCI